MRTGLHPALYCSPPLAPEGVQRGEYATSSLQIPLGGLCIGMNACERQVQGLPGAPRKTRHLAATHRRRDCHMGGLA